MLLPRVMCPKFSFESFANTCRFFFLWTYVPIKMVLTAHPCKCNPDKSHESKRTKKVQNFPFQMIHKPSRSGRRILTFPAVHPCEAISPKALLISLIDLAQGICSFESKFFASNAQNAREIIRQTGIILVFLEEIRDGLLELPVSVVLGFSELHLAFQKIRYLLEDCTTDGARLWMLMKSEWVANQFRVLARAIATGLDVLPLGEVDVSGEVKELVELVAKQAREVSFEVNPSDKKAVRDVMLILNRFEDGILPERSDLDRVLDYLNISKWSLCNREAKFLDAEIGLEYSNPEKRSEITVLSSLIGFMTYCRCMLFDSVDADSTPQVRSNSGVLRCLNSDDFRCPISLELMKEPVTLSTGHTYDRASIQQWFRAGNHTCPKTGEKLRSTKLVPNLVLKGVIQQYCAENGIPMAESSRKTRDITRTVTAGSLAAKGATKMVANFLSERLANGSNDNKIKAAFEIRLLSKASIFNRSCLVEVGVLPLLLKLLLSTDPLMQENAIASLLNLSKHSKSKAVIVESKGLQLIVNVLKEGLKMEARQHAAATLFYLASIEEYRRLIGEIPDAIPALVALIKEGKDRCKKNALVAIFGLLMNPSNHWRVLAAGAVPLLLELLTVTDREELVTDSLAVLATLAEKPDGATAILPCRALHQIIGILDSSISGAGKEHCVSLLLALCINGGADVIGLLVKSSSLMGSLYSILSDGTPRASKKASALIRVLHEFYERTSSGLMVRVLAQEQFIHVW